jgi:hypothetical protein
MAIRECGFAMPELDHLFKIAVMQRFLRPAQLPPAFDDPHNALLPIGLEPLRKVLRLRPIPSHLE